MLLGRVLFGDGDGAADVVLFYMVLHVGGFGQH